MTKRLLLASQYAFYPFHWKPFCLLCEQYNLQGSIIATPPPELPAVHQQLGWVSVEEARKASFAPDIRIQPAAHHEQYDWLKNQLDELQPHAIWIQEEPISQLALNILKYYQRNRSPRIAVAVCENMFPRPSFRKRWRRARLWQRIDQLLATASSSVESIQRAGMPAKVRAETLVAGAHAPPQDLEPIHLPFERDSQDFVVGFAGRICHEKGWKILLDAIASLPGNIKVALAGGGPQSEELNIRLKRADLKDRSAYLGLLPKEKLWSFYKSLDCLAVPSLTVPGWKEQFGGVLADAMAIGLPIVGSDSGAIPEVIGPAGIVVPENNSVELAGAIRQLTCDSALSAEMSAAGKQRFDQEFSLPTYARKIASALELSNAKSQTSKVA